MCLQSQWGSQVVGPWLEPQTLRGMIKPGHEPAGHFVARRHFPYIFPDRSSSRVSALWSQL